MSVGVACKGVKGQLYPTAGFCCLGKVRARFNVKPPSRDDRQVAQTVDREDLQVDWPTSRPLLLPPPPPPQPMSGERD